jgi:hypothetical protein
MPSNNTLEAERADRISRLAGLERVSTARPQNPHTPGGSAVPGANLAQIPGYFDQNGNPVYTTKMSTVGSASATGSVGGGQTTTWASGSTKGATERDDDDEMSMDANYRDIDDRDRYSASAMDEDMDGDGMSDNTSLVGFGEGAGSTVSGPTYSRREAPLPAAGRSLAGQLHSGTPNSASTTLSAELAGREARMIDGVNDDDTTRTRAKSSGVETAEGIMKDRLDDGDERKPPLGSPDEAGIGKFYFEEKK